MRYENDQGSDKGSDESLTSTDMTNGKLLISKDKLALKQPIKKVSNCLQLI